MLRIPKGGAVLLCDAYESLRELGAGWQEHKLLNAPLYWYGTNENSDYQILDREAVEDAGGQFQQLKFKLRNFELELRTSETGLHNAQNMLAAAAVGELIGLSPQQIKQGLASYRGVLRRQVVVHEANDILVIDDFAHHPTAVRLTLEGLRERYPESRIVAVYEPRSNTSRRAFFQDAYGSAFDSADAVYIKKVEDAGGYSATSGEIAALDAGKLIGAYQAKGKTAFCGTVDEILTQLEDQARAGDVIVVMSNGDFAGLLPRLKKQLGSREG